MASQFKRSESLANGVERQIRRQLDAALELLSTSTRPLDYRVHEARKCLKRLRALFALTEGSLDRDLVERERSLVRSAAHALAELRSAAALSETFTALVERYPGVLSESLVHGVQHTLAQAPERAAPDKAVADAIEALAKARDVAGKLEVTSSGFAVIDRGFRRTYARARRRFRRAQRSREVDDLHEFRTQQKRHFYQLELFTKWWPKVIRAECRELDRLGERLGEHHDLSLLMPELERRGFTAELAADLPALIDRRRSELESAITHQAARLFAESPRARARRFQAYYDALELRPQKKP